MFTVETLSAVSVTEIPFPGYQAAVRFVKFPKVSASTVDTSSSGVTTLIFAGPLRKLVKNDKELGLVNRNRNLKRDIILLYE